MGIFDRRTGPDFIIVGAQKAGTTALHQMLEQHPNISAADIKEVHYFDNDAWHAEGKTHQYHKFFPKVAKQRSGILTFEASPLYIYHPKVAQRLYEYNPSLKLIAVLREPAARAFSAWTMYHHHFKTGRHKDLHDPRTFDIAIAEDLEGFENSDYTNDIRAYVKRGLYAAQLERYYRYFSHEQILVLESRDISEKWTTTSKLICDFLSLPAALLPHRTALQRKVNQAEVYVDTFDHLRSFFAPYNSALETVLGRDLGWNNSW